MAVAHAKSLERDGDKIPDDMTKNGWYIEVLMPEVIKADPQKAYREAAIAEQAEEICNLIKDASEKIEILAKFNGTPGVLSIKDALRMEPEVLINILAGAAARKSA